MDRPFQFGLRTIFWAMAAVGVGCLALPWVAPMIELAIGWLWLPLYVIAGFWFALCPYHQRD